MNTLKASIVTNCQIFEFAKSKLNGFNKNPKDVDKCQLDEMELPTSKHFLDNIVIVHGLEYAIFHAWQ